MALVAPYSRGNVTINSADAAKPPVINPNWLTDPQDQAVVVAGYKRARQIFNSRAMAPILIGTENFPGVVVQTDAQILDTIKKTFTTVFHASCSCKMGHANDPAAVVDSKARVFGVKGLRVVDAASFALLPPGHPVSTVCTLKNDIPFRTPGVVLTINCARCTCRENRSGHFGWELTANKMAVKPCTILVRYMSWGLVEDDTYLELMCSGRSSCLINWILRCFVGIVWFMGG